MAELNDHQKLRIVMMLAQFYTPTEIVKDFREAGIDDLTVAQVGSYDPTRTYFEAGKRWEKIFHDERERFMKEVQTVPIANQGYRLQMLQRTLETAVKTGNKVLANQTLRQAAEEVGGALTNERNVNVKRPVEELTADERRAMFAELVQKALEQKDPPGTAPAPPAVQ